MDFNPSAPIWLQLVEEFSRRIAVGDWEPGQKIAGVRELAGEVGVNPNTVQRSLSELEREGLCRSERTAGRFVTTDTALLTQLRRRLALGVVDDFVHRARGFQITYEDAQALVSERWNNDDRATGTPEE